MKIQTLLRNKTVKNAGWLIAGKLLNKVCAFLVSVLAARFLGPDNYGLINYATAYTTFFASVCTLGINSVIVKNFIDHPEQEGETIGTSLLLRAASSLLSVVMILGIVFLLDGDSPLTIAVVGLCSLGLVFQVFDTLNYWFQARLMSRYVAIASFIAYAVMSAYKLVLLVCGSSVLWFALATSVDYITLAAILLLCYVRQGGPRFSCSLAKAKELLQASKSFILSGLMVSIYASTDKLMLKQMMDEASVGYYSLAVSASTAWAFVLSAVIESMYPTIARLHSTDKAAFARKNRQLYALIFYAAGAVSLAVFLFAPQLVRLLYGSEYLPAVAPLRIVVWYTAFSYLGGARNVWMVCENKQHYLTYLYAASAGINVLLNALLIPLWGTAGAAAASLMTQIATIALPAAIPPLRENARLMWDAILLRGVLPGRRDPGSGRR